MLDAKLKKIQIKRSFKEESVRRLFIIALGILSFLYLEGCKWRDDFRDRAQPQLLEQGPRPTLNPDSIDYTGNPIKEEARIEKETELPCIDGLSDIPEVPEYPAGVGLD